MFGKNKIKLKNYLKPANIMKIVILIILISVTSI